MKKLSLHRLLLSYLCIGSALFLGGCGGNEELQAPLRQVRSIIVSPGKGVYARSFSGTLYASQETSLSFKVSGTIQEILVKVGDQVKEGDIIAILDPSTYELEAQKAQASLAEEEANLRNEKANYDRVKKLYIGGNVSRNELDNARASSESALASMEAARKALDLANLDVSYTELTVENDFAIASVDAEVGENVSNGTQIFYGIGGEDLEIELDIPESIIASIKLDSEVLASFPALEGKTFHGKVSEVGVSSVAGGTTFPVTVLITDEQKSELKSGLSAEVTFTVSTASGNSSKIIVPPFAIGEDEAGRFVFILSQTNEDQAVVKRQPVEVGNVLPIGIEILQGLQPGMRVVTAGVSVLRDGTEVKYTDE
ncbi:MAG: efflux RND transporter periplasmic adaptor subunit [Verrucomicrobiota bacterium]